MVELFDHEWPKKRDEHLWGPWMPHSRNKIYRTCSHPECGEHEIKDVK